MPSVRQPRVYTLVDFLRAPAGPLYLTPGVATLQASIACRGSSFTAFVDVILAIFRHPRTFVDQERGAFLPAFGLPSFLPLFLLCRFWHPRTFGFPRKLGQFLL